MTNNLTDFSFDEISEWINDSLYFVLKPREIISKILNKSKEKITRQFFFHFIIYTTSFIFLTLGESITDWIKPAIINLFIAIPLIILFILSTKIITNNNYSKEIIVFIVGCLFIFCPLLIITYSTFLNTENYTYKYFTNIFSSLISFFIIIKLGYAIEQNKRKALKITITNYLIINLIYFAFERVNTDPYSNENFDIYDPIYTEYSNLVKPLENKELIPTSRTVTIFNDKLDTHFGTQDIIRDKQSNSSNEAEKLYLKSIEENISHIKEFSKTIKFNRNREISEVWLKYFNDIKDEAEFKVKDFDEVKKLKMNELPIKTLNQFGGRMFMMGTDVGKIISTQIPLKSYNNNIVESHSNSNTITETAEIIIFFFGKTADYIVGDLILKEGDPKPYKEIFLEIE